MDAAGYILIAVNIGLFIAAGIPQAVTLSRCDPKRRSVARWLFILLLVYGAEGFAFSASMATNVLSFALAAVWGVVLGRMLHRWQVQRPVRVALSFCAYTCLPAVSFGAVLVLLMFDGWSPVSVEEGHRFGIPGFVPWPLNTLAGFFAAVVGSAIVGKTIITMGLVRLLVRRRSLVESPG